MAGVSLVLNGKVALVTGGSRGIGAETVRLFAAAGARVVFSYRRAKEQALALMDECGGPTRCVPIEQDLRSPADGRALVGAAVKAFGRLDALVVNHGVWPAEDAPIELMTEEQWRNTIAVNLDSVFGLVQAAVVQMELQGPPATGDDGTRGHIVLISSTAGQRGEAMHADYAVTKGALISLTKSLSTELAPRGIMVNCVAPGGWRQICRRERWGIRRWVLGSRLGFRWDVWRRRGRLRGRCCFCVHRWRGLFPAR